MHEIAANKIDSFSIFVGTGDCNANCPHCAGRIHRKSAPKRDGIIDERLITKTIRTCCERGARYLSISGSGEPTLSPQSVTKVLEIVHRCKKEGIEFSPINLYSNGIRIGKDKPFTEKYLANWKNLGLTTVYITVHDIDEKRNAEIYGVPNYPSLKTILSRIHGAGLLVRANLVLSKNTVDTANKFSLTINYLKELGVDAVSAWSVKNADDKIDKKLSPPSTTMDEIEEWVEKNTESKFKIRLLREKIGCACQSKKLTLFPDGTLTNTWCNS